MKRRDFLATAAAGAVAAASGMTRTARAQTARQPDPAKLARIAIMTFNFNAILKLPTQPASPARTLEVFDVPQMLADTYGVHNVEFQHTHLASTEDSYLRELRARLDKSGSRMSNVNLEFGTMNISAADATLRQQAIDQTKQWVDHALILGTPRVMINQGQLTDESKTWAVPALKAMVDYGRSKGIKISVETRLGGGGGRGAAAAGTAAPAATAATQVPAAPGAASATPAAGVGRAGAPAAAVTGAATATPAPTPAAAGRGTGAAPVPVMTAPPLWPLLAEVIKNAGAYSNVDIGNVNAQDQGELHAALRTLLPMTVGNIHTRISPAWDLPTALRFINGSLNYTGLFSIEAPGGHDPVRYIYNVILDTI